MNWQRRAACKGVDPELFFPGSGERRKIVKAKEICKGCPVNQQCLNFTLRHEAASARFGIYGGLTQEERNNLFGAA